MAITYRYYCHFDFKIKVKLWFEICDTMHVNIDRLEPRIKRGKARQRTIMSYDLVMLINEV